MSLSYESFSFFNLISLLLLYGALIPYCIVKELKSQNHGRFVVCQISSMILAYSTILIVNVSFLLQKKVPIIGYYISFLCFGHGYIVQFAFLSAASWLNVMFFSIWREARWLRSGRRQISFDRGRQCINLTNTFYGWGLPLTIMLITCASNAFGAVSFGDTFKISKPGALTCFFDSSLFPGWIFFSGPLVLIMFFNLLLLCLTAQNLFSYLKDNESLMPQIVTNENNFKNREGICRERLLMYTEVFVVLCGHTLVITILPDSTNQWYIYAACFSFTSVLLCLIYLCSPGALGPVKVWMCPSDPPVAPPSEATLSPTTSVMSPFNNSQQDIAD